MRNFVFTFIVLIAVSVFVSCSKQHQDQSQLQNVGKYPPHPSAGNEIQMDSLGWEVDDYNVNVFIAIHNRPDLFMPYWKMDISLKLDTSSVWTAVNPSNGFVYHLGPGSLGIAPLPPDTSLVHFYVALKIKFY